MEQNPGGCCGSLPCGQNDSVPLEIKKGNCYQM